jgi:hypothetical protein
MPKNSLAESPSGLVHLITVYERSAYVPTHGKGRSAVIVGTTRCGRDCNWDTWGRISQLDHVIQGRSLRSIKSMLELPTCDRCFT